MPSDLSVWLDRLAAHASVCAAGWRGRAEDDQSTDAAHFRAMAGMWDCLAGQAREWARKTEETEAEVRKMRKHAEAMAAALRSCETYTTPAKAAYAAERYAAYRADFPEVTP